MAAPRLLLIALLASILAAVAFYATRGGATAPPPPAPAAPQPSAKPSSPKHDAPANGAKQPDTKSPQGNAGSADKSAKPDPVHTPAKPKPAVKGVPRRLSRALAQHKVVVLFFRQRHGSDDSATAGAVAGVRGTRGVAVFTDNIRHLDRYPRLIGSLGISQAPSVVIVGRDREASLIEGYVDGGSLKQRVLDAR
jgi:hypothetical protein